MDDEDNDYELERQKTIAENQQLLNSLGFDANGSAKLNFPKPEKPARAKVAQSSKKRKSTASTQDEGPRRRSGRIAGLEADGEQLKVKLEEEEKERAVLRVVARKEREQVMKIRDMQEEGDEEEKDGLDRYLADMASQGCPRRLPEASSSANEAYADLDTSKQVDEVQRLKDQFKNMELRGNAKVTNDRVFSMVVHPDKTKDLVFVGDKYGCLGIWDALGPSTEKVKDEDDTAGIKTEENGEDVSEGSIWRIQAHARNSITAMKVDPINGSGLYSSSYDCTLRHLDFAKLTSTELFAHPDEDMLVTHFDLTPAGHEAWLADKNGGISHCDFREGQKDRRRWVVQEDGRAAKLGGLSVNPLMPHLLVTAGNDQHLRIWDTRHFSHLNPRSTEVLTPAAKTEDGKPPRIDTYPSSSIGNEKVGNYLSSAKGKGLHRASFQHGKSCSAAYWDPWGRRILTTSYDDKLRIWSLNPDSFTQDAPLPPTHFKPAKQIPHNCQTGRWLTILRAQWSLNMDFTPHFTVGNMKRSLDVFAATGERIVALWADPVTAVPAVTTSHPGRVDHVYGGNTSGRIQFWASGDSS